MIAELNWISGIRSIWLVALSILITAPQIAGAKEFGDPVNGRIYAKNTCAVCHAVLPDESVFPVSEATSFVMVANTPGMTRTALTVFLQTPHPTMPNLVIEPQDMDDVIAYILSLKSD